MILRGALLVGFLALGLPQPAAACTLADWQTCPGPLEVGPEAGPAPGQFRLISSLIVDLEDYESLQFARFQVPGGTATPEWHRHAYDALVLPIRGAARFWWIDRESGETRSLVQDSADEAVLLIPEGLAHFVDLRAAESDAEVIEVLLAREPGWTAEDFLAGRIPVEAPIPPLVPLAVVPLD